MLATSMKTGAKPKDHLETLINIFRMGSYERNMHYHDRMVECLSKFDFFARRTDFTDDFRVISEVSGFLELKSYKAGDIVYEKDDSSLFIGFVLSGSFGKYEPNTHIKTEPSHQTHSPQSNSHERPQAVSTTDTFNSKQLGIKKASTESIGSENVRQFRLHSSRKIFGSNTPIVFNNFATEPAEEASGRSPTSFMSNLSPKSQSAQRVQGASIRIVKDLQNELTALVKKNNKLSKFVSEGSCLVNRTGLISPGETFGERSVSLGEQRRNSMVCLADGNALILPSEYFRKYFQKGPVEVEGDKVYFLKSLLKDITIEKAKQLAQYLEEVTIQPRTVIFSATDTPDALYFVKSGKVHLFRNQPQGKTFEEDNLYGGKVSDHSSDSKREQPKKKKLFAFCSVGNLGFFGEETLYKRAVRQYTAISECYSILYKISSKAFKKCEDELKEIGEYIQSKSTMQTGIKSGKFKEKDSKRILKSKDTPLKSAGIFKTNVKLQPNHSDQSSQEPSYFNSGKNPIPEEKVLKGDNIFGSPLQQHSKCKAEPEKPDCSFFSNPNDSFVALIHNTENSIGEYPSSKQRANTREDLKDDSPINKITAFWESHLPRKQISPEFRKTDFNFVRPSTKAATTKPVFEFATQRIGTAAKSTRIHFNGMTNSSRPSTSQQFMVSPSSRDLQGQRIMTSALSRRGESSNARVSSMTRTAGSREGFGIRRNPSDNAKVSLVIKSFGKSASVKNQMQATTTEHFANFQPSALNNPLESGIPKQLGQKKLMNVDTREAYYMGMISPSLTYTNQFFPKTSQSNTIHFTTLTPKSLDTRLKAVLYRKIR